MIHAEYADGRKYHAKNLDEIDFATFVVDNLLSLRIAQFVWRREEHGEILAHGMRTKQRMTGETQWRIYVAEAEKCKIFVFSTGDSRVLADWIPGTQFFERMHWPEKFLQKHPQLRGKAAAVQFE